MTIPSTGGPIEGIMLNIHRQAYQSGVGHMKWVLHHNRMLLANVQESVSKRKQYTGAPNTKRLEALDVPTSRTNF
jgi:hypothetical protein